MDPKARGFKKHGKMYNDWTEGNLNLSKRRTRRRTKKAGHASLRSSQKSIVKRLGEETAASDLSFSFPNKAIFFNNSVRRRFAPPSLSKTGSKGSKDKLDQRHPELDKAKRPYSEFLSPLDGLRPLIQDFCVSHVQLLDNYTRPAYSWVIEAIERGRFRFSFVNPASPRSLSSDPNYLSKKPSKKGCHPIQVGVDSQDSSTFFPLFEAYFHPRPQAGFEYLFLSRGGSLMSISSGDRWILMSRKGCDGPRVSNMRLGGGEGSSLECLWIHGSPKGCPPG